MNPETLDLFTVYTICCAIGMLFIFGFAMCILWAMHSKKEKEKNAKMFIICAIVEVVGVALVILLLQRLC